MKKLFVMCVIFILSSGFAFTQNFAVDQGAMILGGTAGFSSYGTEGGGSRSTSFYINPVFDYFIIQNLFIGGSLNISFGSSSNYDYTSFGIGPEIGYAFGSSNSSIYPFLKIGFDYSSTSTSYTNTNNKQTSSATDIILGGGAMFEITKHVGIVGLLSYHIMNNKYETSSSSGNAIILGFGIYGLLYK